ncbi:MAG: ribose-phosphate pyrophosphokinase [Akkermansia sp.]|nr:ribose-phosphate pyrophosphokinase [Akkermansia sp.]MCQ2372167.1 ribose-phosphate pyrophosphokinase [Akkermansia sp.]MDO4817482.1 ribose-phosphate pyrophosphokinase [Akkermansia sp.]MDO4953780.1 ribose-phosphate pyrophosphokinase [Akkermansia sp.]
MKLISGTAHPQLAQNIADVMGLPLCDATVNTFPDGESFVQIKESIRGADAFIIQPTCPPTNHNLMELLVMVDAVRRASASRITAVMPFYGYARQDRKDKPRVPITSKLVANLLTAAGVNRVLAMDLHAAQIQGFFEIPVDHLHSLPVLVKHLKEKYVHNMSNLVVVSPDIGGVKNAKSYANVLGTELAIVAKQRISATEVDAHAVIGNVEGKDVLMIDDMTESGGTLCAAAKILKEHGAARIFAGVSHGVLNDAARARLKDSPIECLLTSDSVPMAYGENVDTVSIAPLLAQAIANIHNNDSVTHLFEI